MNRSATGLAAIILVGCAATALIGCAGIASAAPAADDIVIVVGATSGSSALVPSILDEPLAALDREGDRLIGVEGDGEPRVVIDVTVPELPGNGRDREAWLESFRADVRTALLALTPDSAEVDISEAIALGAQGFRPGGTHSLYVHSSGLQTSGLLSLLDGRLYAEPADLVAYAEQQGGVPDLRGVRVRMPLGVVTEPQPALDEDARTSLRGIWAEYFAVSGATDVELVPADLAARVSERELPSVTPVAVQRPDPQPVVGCRQQLNSTSIGFAAGSAELSDAVGVGALLDEVAAALAGCEGDYVIEASASSEGEESDNQLLSEARAERIAVEVRARLAARGADVQVTAIGWGESWPCRMTDLDADGRLLLDAAIANRVVVIGRGETGC